MKLLKYLLPLILFSGCNGYSDQAGTSNPNIVLILADDLGYNDVTCYRNNNSGQPADRPPTSQTPNIDKIAEKGMRFTDFYCGAAVCSPSRAALSTGRNATRLGIYNYIPEDSPMHLRAEEITIAELLKENNYQTGHFGKWHLTSKGTDQPLPNDQGFDYSFFSFNNAIPSHRNPESFYRNGEPLGQMKGYSCGLVVDEAIKWLETKKKSDSPFYINIWFNEPHTKVAAPEELSERHSYNKEYYGCIENMDIAVGKLTNYLETNELDENTIIIFASDNGSRVDNSNDPLRGEKCFNYEGGVRIPFIIKWNNKIPSGETCHFPGSFTDIFPTIARITNSPLPSDRIIDGTDISQVFLGNKTEIYRDIPIFFFRYFHDPICMLRDGEWCLMGYDSLLMRAESLNERELAKISPWYFTEGHMNFLKTLTPKHFELYNLKEDIEQKNDLSEEYPKVVTKMKAEMIELQKEMIEEGGDWYSQSP